MKGRNSGAVFIFLGVLLIVIFVVGLICSKNPDAFQQKYSYDYTLNAFTAFCANWYVFAGIIGIPLFLVSLIISLVREHRNRQ